MQHMYTNAGRDPNKNEPSTVKRRPNKMTGSLSRTGSAGEQEEDEDEEDVGEIGTHRNKESNQGSQHDFTGANRFNASSNAKNQSKAHLS